MSTVGIVLAGLTIIFCSVVVVLSFIGLLEAWQQWKNKPR